jgi:phosphoglycerol transferase MdoB-like AlkP superfamily enzyme
MLSRIPISIRFLAGFYLTGLFLFAFLRVVFLFFNDPGDIDFGDQITWESLRIGFVFDSVVMSYIIALPILLFFLHYMLRPRTVYFTSAIVWVLSVFLSLTIFMVVADIPYFAFFKNKLTVDALQWMNTPTTVLEMVFGNTSNAAFLFLGLFLFSVSMFFVFKIGRNNVIRADWGMEFSRFSRMTAIAAFLFSGLFCFMGMRGKWAHPIRPGDAFYCDHPLLNQAGLNAAYTFLKSFSYKVNLMENETAIRKAQSYLGVQGQNNESGISPFYRLVQGDSIYEKKNVVLILMEGMGSKFMGSFGNQNNLTPNLDSLSKASILFTNAYSAGIHTNNGVFSTLYGFPALKRIRPMSAVPIRKFTGLPFALKQRGYDNYFFCTHNRSFDNIGNFIPYNHFDKIYTEENFPSSESVGPFGVPDGYLFSRLLTHLDSIDDKAPFFVTVLTASNHDPYIIPKDFVSEHKDSELRAIQYADQSIGDFMRKASQTKWFANTLFVLVADHGRVYGKETYDLPLSFSQIPIIFHAPSFIKPRTEVIPMGQIDVFPSIMGVLGGTYLNNTAGVDAFKHLRPIIYFSQDDKIGSTDGQWLYVYRFGGNESLYRLNSDSPMDYLNIEKDTADRLRDYALSQTQASEFVLSSDMTGPTGKRSKLAN